MCVSSALGAYMCKLCVYVYFFSIICVCVNLAVCLFLEYCVRVNSC